MKTLLLIGAIALSINAFSQVPNYVPTNGLAGYWSFTGNASDESINTNDGVVNGATLTMDRFGNSNAAYSFDGLDDYIEVPSDVSLDITGDVTISFWINKPVFNQRYEAAIIKDLDGTGTGINYKMQISFSDNMDFYTSRGASADAFTTSAWHHFVGVSTTDSIHVYIDGVLVNSMLNQFNTNPLITNTLPLSFGRLPYFDANYPGNERMYFEGDLDDIGIWSSAFTQCDVNELYDSQVIESATQNGTLLTADQSGATYQWLDCDDNNAEINGETNQSYTPAVTGNYSVEVTLNGCVDTSACMLVDYTGIDELNLGNKELMKITDLMGREVKFTPNTPLIYIYSDGTTERVFKLEE